jgi:regulatory protein YycI of two-component signal transduction system YycFG
VFLILDLFLAFQFVEKRNSNQLGLLAEATLEDQLKENDITYVDLPKEPIKETYISGTSRVFTGEDLLKLKGQKPQIINKTKIYSQFEKPIPVAEKTPEWLSSFIKSNVLMGDSYVFWGIEEETDILIFFQKYKGRTIFYNNNAVLAIQLNDRNEMVSYQQTILADIEEMQVDEGQTGSFTALKAIENMYERNELKQGSKVTKVDHGYYTLIKDSQVFVPTWHFIIDNKENYFVNAFEGHIIRDSAKWSEE